MVHHLWLYAECIWHQNLWISNSVNHQIWKTSALHKFKWKSHVFKKTNMSFVNPFIDFGSPNWSGSFKYWWPEILDFPPLRPPRTLTYPQHIFDLRNFAIGSARAHSFVDFSLSLSGDDDACDDDHYQWGDHSGLCSTHFNLEWERWWWWLW